MSERLPSWPPEGAEGGAVNSVSSGIPPVALRYGLVFYWERSGSWVFAEDHWFVRGWTPGLHHTHSCSHLHTRTHPTFYATFTALNAGTPADCRHKDQGSSELSEWPSLAVMLPPFHLLIQRMSGLHVSLSKSHKQTHLTTLHNRISLYPRRNTKYKTCERSWTRLWNQCLCVGLL